MDEFRERLKKLIAKNDTNEIWIEEYDRKKAALVSEFAGRIPVGSAEAVETDEFQRDVDRVKWYLEEARRLSATATPKSVSLIRGILLDIAFGDGMFVPWHCARTKAVKRAFMEQGGVDWLFSMTAPQWWEVSKGAVVAAVLSALWSFGDAEERRDAVVRPESFHAVMRVISDQRLPEPDGDTLVWEMGMLSKALGLLWGLLEFPAIQEAFSAAGGIRHLARLIESSSLRDHDTDTTLGCLTSATEFPAACASEDAVYALRAATKLFPLVGRESVSLTSASLVVSSYQTCLLAARVLGSRNPHLDRETSSRIEREVEEWREAHSPESVRRAEYELQFQWCSMKPFAAMTRSPSLVTRRMGCFALDCLCRGRENRKVAAPVLPFILSIRYDRDPVVRQYGAEIATFFDAADHVDGHCSHLGHEPAAPSTTAGSLLPGLIPPLKHLAGLAVFNHICSLPNPSSIISDLTPDIKEIVFVS